LAKEGCALRALAMTRSTQRWEARSWYAGSVWKRKAASSGPPAETSMAAAGGGRGGGDSKEGGEGKEGEGRGCSVVCKEYPSR